VGIAWNSLVDDTWMHVHMETTAAFSDNVNFMSKSASSGSASFGNCKVFTFGKGACLPHGLLLAEQLKPSTIAFLLK